MEERFLIFRSFYGWELRQVIRRRRRCASQPVDFGSCRAACGALFSSWLCSTAGLVLCEARSKAQRELGQICSFSTPHHGLWSTARRALRSVVPRADSSVRCKRSVENFHQRSCRRSLLRGSLLRTLTDFKLAFTCQLRHACAPLTH